MQMLNRKIEFEKIQNARDLGGLETRDGHVIKSGCLLRSANLSEAADADVKKLENVYRLAKIVDLRTSVEKKERPDAAVEGAEYLPVPVFDERVAGISHEKTGGSALQIPAMEGLYRMIVTDETCRKNLGKAVRIIMGHDFTQGSVLWHCTEGKDRCGLVTVLVLGALGVERQQITEDYLITNEVNEPKAQMYYRQILLAGRSEAEADAVRNAFLAKESYLSAAFAAIEEKYPDLESYLKQGLGIPEQVIWNFRKNVLG